MEKSKGIVSLLSQNYEKLLLTAGLVVTLISMAKRYRRYRQRNQSELQELIEKIESTHDEEIFVKLSGDQYVVEDSGIKFIVIQLIPNTVVKKAQKLETSPFLPPFDQGRFIIDLSLTHRLLFNKYWLTKQHLLITTCLYENQENYLNENDLTTI